MKGFDFEPEYRRRIREKAEKDHQTTKGKRQESNNEHNIDKITAAIKRVEQELIRANDEQTPQKKRDRCWERFGFLGLWFAGFVGIAAIWFGTHDASEQRGVTQGQLNVMQSEFTATQRPWISVDSMKISSPLFFNANGDITLSVHFSLTNSGRTPGIFVYPNVTFVLMTMTTGQLSTIIGKTREHCESKRLGKFSPMESGILVPPGKNITHPFHFGITITSDDIKRGKDVVRGREAILPYIGGCINYQFTFGERQRHQTGFVYELLGPDTFIFWIVATSRSINSPSSNRMAVGPIKRVRNRYGGARRLLT